MISVRPLSTFLLSILLMMKELNQVKAMTVRGRNMEESDFELYADGTAEVCPEGKEVTVQECLQAAHDVGSDLPLQETLNIGSWNHTPCGCFIYNDHLVDYKEDHGDCLADPNSNLVCRKEVTLLPPPPETDFELYPYGLAGSCPEGKEVAEQDCLDAAKEVGYEMILKDFLNVGSWPFTPCGCFIYIDHWVDFKDPGDGSCTADPKSNLVCRKEKILPPPSPAPSERCESRTVAFKSVDYFGSFLGTYSSAYEENSTSTAGCIILPGIPTQDNQYCVGDSFIIDVAIYDESGTTIIGHKLQQTTVVSAEHQFTEGFGSFMFEDEEGALFIQSHGRGATANIAITSGTGSFKGASGEVSFVEEDDADHGVYRIDFCIPGYF